MAFKIPILVAALLCSTGLVCAQQGLWQQCGGIGWTGATSCESGSVCTVQNSYYSQCLPGSASAAPTSTASASGVPTATATAGSGSSSSIPADVNFWFSFGDSYTQTDFDPSGTPPSVGNPLGNPPYPGYTAVGGVNWIDVDTVQYNKSLILTWNYAYGGATIDASLVQPYEPTVLSMTDQVNQFLSGAALKPDDAPWTSENSLFSFWIGINDLGNSYYEPGDRDAFSDTLLDAYFALVQKIYAVGGRNFLFINVPPTDRSPLMTPYGDSACELLKSVIADYNTKLAERATQLEANYTDVTTWLWDSNTAFSLVLDDPTAFGFVDNSSYGNTGDFWGNNLHPSSAAQQIWGQNVSTLLENTVW